jgi:hypothetical protein
LNDEFPASFQRRSGWFPAAIQNKQAPGIVRISSVSRSFGTGVAVGAGRNKSEERGRRRGVPENLDAP